MASRSIRILGRTALAGAVALSPMSPVAAAAGPADAGAVTVVATGLDDPRGLAFAPWGALYVTEAGRGGDGPCVPGVEPGSSVCVGATGAITRIWLGRQARIASGLPSSGPEFAPPPGNLGPADIAFDPFGRAFVTFGLGLPPASRDLYGPKGADLGKLFRLRLDATRTEVADIAAYEQLNDPDAGEPGGDLESNANGVLAGIGGQVVVDSAANDLLAVDGRGEISTLAVFPSRFVEFPPGSGNQIPMDSVPTSVVRGPDGAFYVGELTGFPFPVGAARVWRVVPGRAPTVYADWFTTVIDLAFDMHGRLFVLQFATGGLLGPPTPGTIVRVNADGSRTTIVDAPLFHPTAMTRGPGGDLYVSNRGGLVEPGTGEVLRVHVDGPS